MTLRVTRLPDSVADTPQWRTFCQMVHDNFAATGMVRTADAGQIDVLSTTKPGTAGAVAGYEMWRMTDPWATVAPVYIKVEYGTGGQNNYPNLWFTVGTGSDGIGGLTYGAWPGSTSPIARRSSSPYSGISGTPQVGNFYFVHLPDQSFAMTAWPSVAINGTGTWTWGIERFRDHTGATLPDGINTFYAGTAATNTECYQDGSRYLPGAQQGFTGQPHWVTLSSTIALGYARPVLQTLFQTVTYPVPVFTGLQPRMASPSKLYHLVGRQELAPDLIFQLDHYGEECSWVSPGPGNPSAGFGDFNGLNDFVYATFVMRAD